MSAVRPADNPYRSARIEALAFRCPGGIEGLLARLDAQGRRGLLVGPHGAGKTTALLELAAAIEHRWDLRRREISVHTGAVPSAASLRHGVRDIGPEHLLLVDGLDLLGACRFAALRRAVRRAGAVLATSHRAGRLPVLHEHRTSPALLGELVAELVGPRRAASVDVDALFRRYRGDLRAALRALYDEEGA